jgi:23S rRNA (guanosine2251-2'-O)-methyltransferase
MKPWQPPSKTRRSSPDTAGGREESDRWLYRRHAVAAALANPQRRWYRLAALVGHEQEARALVDRARARLLGDGDAIRVLDRHQFVEILPDGAVHQGLALAVEPLATPDLVDLV